MHLYQRLSIPFLYRHPVISRPVALELFANRLVSDPYLAWHMRTFALHVNAHHGGTMDHTEKIFSRTTGLVRVYGETCGLYVQPIKTSWNGFNSLAYYSGHTLLELHHIEIMMPTELPQQPSVFIMFMKLRSLHWSSRTMFNDLNPTLAIPAFLPALESIHFVQYDKSFATILSYMEYVAARTASVVDVQIVISLLQFTVFVARSVLSVRTWRNLLLTQTRSQDSRTGVFKL
jgi:hypothetical protein